jgi:hypothetical protein
MSYNTPKIINVFYKEDRKPYDVNGKAISYFGEDFIGANDATKIRFYFTPSISLTEFEGAVHAKRADGELRYEILTKSSDDLGNYLELSLNAWFTGKVGKVTLSVKIYSGDITYGYLVEGEPPTSIESLTNAVIVASDVFSFNVGYAPNATEVAPPFDDTDIDQFLTALSQKASLGQTIYVVPELPENLSDYDNQWFLVKSPTGGNVGKLFHINLPDAEEVELGVEQLNLTPSGNGDVVSGDVKGQVKWNADLGTISFGLYDDVEIGAGDTLFWFVKAQSNIAKGDVVQFAGNVGGEVLIKKAVFAEITAQPDLLMGVAKHAIIEGNKGYIISAGRLNNINTSGSNFSTSQPILYLSTTTDGQLTSTKPTSGFKGSIAAVGRFSTGGGSNGFLLVRPNLIKGVGELTDVTLTSATNGDVLRLQSGVWVNANGLTVAEDEIDTLQNEMDAVEGRLDVVEPIVEQHTTDISDLDERIDFIEDNGGIDFIKVADFASLPTSGDVRNHRLFLTQDTNKLYEFDGTSFNEVRQDKLTADSGEEDGFLQVGGGTLITHSGVSDATALQVFQTSILGSGGIIEASNATGIQFAVNKDGSVNAYGDLTIAGNLTVSGTTTTVNTQTLDVEDNIITINKNQTETPETNLLSGIEVERGDETNFQFVFQESSDLFKVGQVNDLQAVATREDSPNNLGVPFFNTTTKRFETKDNFTFSESLNRLSAPNIFTLVLANNANVNSSAISLSSTGTAISRNIADANSALKVNLANASATGNIAEFQKSGTNLSWLDNEGNGRFPLLANRTTINNSRVDLNNTGVVVQRNIADANPSLIVNLQNASSTGNIANFQFAGANKLEVTKDGFLTQNGDRLFTQIGGNTNTFFGQVSGGTSTTGTSNTGFGFGTLFVTSTGSSNTAVGRSALQNNTTGGVNTAVGDNSLLSNTTGSFNTAFGVQSLSTSTISSFNTANGESSLRSVTTGSGNSAFGISSGRAITTGSNNSFLGREAGQTGAWGTQLNVSNSTALGYQAFTDKSNQMVFGNASVTEFKFDRNSDAVALLPNITAVSGLQHYIERTTDITNNIVGSLRMIATTSGNMVNGFGPIIGFNIKDNESEVVPVAYFGALRSGADNSGRFVFQTRNAGTFTEKMTIMPDGNVGIGTTNPTERLQIGTNFQVTSTGVTLWGNNSENGALTWDTGKAIIGGRTGNALDIRTNNTTKVHITTDGKVGIGTSSPVELLHIQNTTNVASYIRTTGSTSYANYILEGGRSYSFGTAGSSETTLGLANKFYIRDNTGNAQRFVIDNSGLVGINETSPTAQLQVKSGATNRVGLIVDTLASHTAFLQEWRVNGTALTRVYDDGTVGTPNVRNLSSINNSRIALDSTGTTIFRNIADTNPSLIVNLANASATGDITRFQKAGTTQSFVDNRGVFYKNETKLTLTNPTFTETGVGTANFEYTLTEAQINANDVIEITKDATANGQLYRLIIPNNSKQIRIWFTVNSSGSSTIAEVELTKVLGESVEYIFDRQEANSVSLLKANTSNYLSYNVSNDPISFLYRNVNGTQKSLSVSYVSEI